MPPHNSQDSPSLYPTVTAEPPAATRPPPTSHPASTASTATPSAIEEPLPPTYELLIELPSATLAEQSPTPQLSRPVSGTLKVVQGPLQPASPPSQASYHSFISIQSFNIPLLSTHPAACISTSPPIFTVRIPDRLFAIELSPATDPELVDSFKRILQWFCCWNAHPSDTAPMSDAQGKLGSAARKKDRIARAGDRGVEFVQAMGARINSSITGKLSAKVEHSAREGEPRNISTGGAVTAKVLSGTRTVVGAGASAASVIIDKVSSAVGTGLAKNPVSKHLANAPEGSTKRNFHDNLMAGMLAFGRVYVAADEQGKLIIQNTGDGASEYARVKYGPEAENAARKVGAIALDGYRIARFPQKLGAAGLLKGALKSNTKKETDASSSGHPELSSSDFGMSTGNNDDMDAGLPHTSTHSSIHGYREEPSLSIDSKRTG